MSEADLYKWLYSKVTPRTLLERIENGLAAGTADVNYLIAGGEEGWIELKHSPKWGVRKPTFEVHRGLTEDQITWHLRRLHKGGKTYILAQIEDYRVMVEGKHAEAFNSMTREDYDRLNVLDEWLRRARPV